MSGKEFSYKQIEQEINKRKHIYVDVLPKDMNVDRFLRNLLLAIAGDKKLWSCDLNSLFWATIASAQFGLEVNTAFHHATLRDRNKNIGTKQVPNWITVASFEPQYEGLVAMLWRTGKISSLNCKVIFSSDNVRIIDGSTPKIEHEVILGEEGRGKIVGCYCIIKFKDRHLDDVVEICDRVDFEAFKAASMDKNSSSPYIKWPDMMFRKSTYKRSVRYLDIDPSIRVAIDIDDYAIIGEDQKIEEKLAILGTDTKLIKKELSDGGKIKTATVSESLNKAAENSEKKQTGPSRIDIHSVLTNRIETVDFSGNENLRAKIKKWIEDNRGYNISQAEYDKGFDLDQAIYSLPEKTPEKKPANPPEMNEEPPDVDLPKDIPLLQILYADLLDTKDFEDAVALKAKADEWFKNSVKCKDDDAEMITEGRAYLGTILVLPDKETKTNQSENGQSAQSSLPLNDDEDF